MPRWGWADKGTALGEELQHVRGFREPEAPHVLRRLEVAERSRVPPPPGGALQPPSSAAAAVKEEQ